jgi:hypothetical protein
VPASFRVGFRTKRQPAGSPARRGSKQDRAPFSYQECPSRGFTFIDEGIAAARVVLNDQARIEVVGGAKPGTTCSTAPEPV